MTQERSGRVWAGLGLIGLGIALVLAQWIGWDRLWPLFPILGGLAFFGGYVASGFREEGFVFVGTAAVLVGLFLFGFTFGIWEWDDMATLWPVFALIGGVAFFTLFLADRARDMGVLGVGCAAVIVGLVGLAFTYGFIGEDILKLWPLLFILVGVIGLVGGLLRMGRRD